MSRVATGLERVLAGDARACDGKRLGLVVNATAIDAALGHAIDRMTADPRFEVRALFGPEHGLRGDAQDMISVDAARDAHSGLPVHSLYGAEASTLSPTPASLDGLDALVFDIQDVGARYYTYVWTMVLCMRAAARAGIGFVVLDRPNPIGGDAIEGGAIAPGYDSFVGLCSVPNRHGLTAGEIARMVMARENLDLDLEVVAMGGWRRDMRWADTGLPWVQPSPNMPTPDTALVYPGMCLVEGTEVSEGRGTTRPFELAGAPYVDGHRLAAALEAEALPGLRCRPLVFTPMFQKHARSACGGIQLHVTDERAFDSYLTGVAFVRAVHALWPEQFAWRGKAYEFVADRAAIDLLTGSPQVRQGIEAGASLADLAATWAEAGRAFAGERQPWLLYT
jgi:uncharacterized protein YbbC (DUF1343 family)